MAMTEQQVVVGVFADHAAAERAIHELQRAGFSDNQIRYSVKRGNEGILDGLVGMGMQYSEAGYYNREFQAGRTIVAVKVNQRQQDAYDILRLSGAYDAQDSPTTGSKSNPRISNKQTMQVREETLQAQKRWVQTEEIRIRRRVIIEEKVFKVPVSREEIIIERVPLNPGTSSAPEQHHSIPEGEGSVVTLADGESIKIPIREERVRLQKVPMIVEEITLTKRVLQETKHITDTILREKVRLERSGNVHIQGDNLDNQPLPSTPTE